MYHNNMYNIAATILNRYIYIYIIYILVTLLFSWTRLTLYIMYLQTVNYE